MHEIINKFLLLGDKFMPQMHLKQPGFTYSACGPFTKHAERIKKFKQTGNASYIFKNELDKACFKHDSAYADYKDLLNRTRADKVLRDKAYEIASDNKYDGYQRGLASMVYKFVDKKTSSKVKRAERTQRASGSGVKRVDTKTTNIELADELHKPVIKKFSRRKVLDDIVKKSNGTINKSIDMKPKDVSDDVKAEYVEESNEKSARFSVGERVRISKFKNVFAKEYTPNWSKEIFVVSRVNNTVPWTYVLKDLNDEEIIGSFYDREL